MSNPNIVQGFQFNGNMEDHEKPLSMDEHEHRMVRGMAAVMTLVDKHRFARAADILLQLYGCRKDGRPFTAVEAEQAAFEQGILRL